MSKSFDGKFYVENKDDEPKMDDKNESLIEKNPKMDATKD